MEKLNPILRKINKLYYFLFKERFSKRLNLKFDNVFRWDLINYLNSIYKFESYLEIGCNEDELFSKIKIKNKVGIDPVKGGNLKITSDEFFSNNTEKIDLIFIDGLHVYSQVKKDIYNSINSLSNNGYVLVHDCLPQTLSAQAVPRQRNVWNGDVWKAIVDFRTDPNLEIFTCLADQGIGIIQKKYNSNVLKLEKEVQKLKFEDYFQNYEVFMRPITFKQFKEKYKYF